MLKNTFTVKVTWRDYSKDLFTYVSSKNPAKEEVLPLIIMRELNAVKVKVKQSCYRPGVVPRGFQEFKVPRFHDNSTGWW